MQTDTPESLLEAVGVDWRANEAMAFWRLQVFGEIEYTGPALGTPELDAILWVEGQKWLASFAEVNNTCWDVLFRVRKNAPKQFDITNDIAAVYLVAICPNPGHALARAIREARNGN